MSKDVHGKMIDQMMIPIHAIVSSEELEGHHMHAFRKLDKFFKLWLLEEGLKEGHNRKKEDIFDMTINLEDHYTNLFGPDLITESSSKRETEGDDRGEEERCSGNESEENRPLIQAQNSIVGSFKDFSNAVNASMIRRQTEQSLSFNKTKNLGELSFYDYSS